MSGTATTVEDAKRVSYRHLIEIAARRTSHELWKELDDGIPKIVFRKLNFQELFPRKKYPTPGETLIPKPYYNLDVA